MPKYKKNNSRAGTIFVAGIWIILIVVMIAGFTSKQNLKTTPTAVPTPTPEPTPTAATTETPAPQTTAPETKKVKSRDLTDKDRKIIGECARHLRTLENLFLEFKDTETFREYGFSHPDYKEWKITLERIQKILDKATDGYFILEYADVCAAAFWLHSAAMEAAMEDTMESLTGRKKPDRDKKEREYIQMIDENLEPFLAW